MEPLSWRVAGLRARRLPGLATARWRRASPGIPGPVVPTLRHLPASDGARGRPPHRGRQGGRRSPIRAMPPCLSGRRQERAYTLAPPYCNASRSTTGRHIAAASLSACPCRVRPVSWQVHASGCDPIQPAGRQRHKLARVSQGTLDRRQADCALPRERAPRCGSPPPAWMPATAQETACATRPASWG